jgi:enoyl-CoA hydratase/carnithine racemase
MIRHWIKEGSRVAVVELASPKNRNALSLSMLTELRSIIVKYSGEDGSGGEPANEKTHGVRAIVLQHQGVAFSSGHDLKELKTYVDANDRRRIEELFAVCSSTMKSIVRCPVPIIAKVNGIATAAGCQLVASCDLAYATASSQFATPGVNIGLFCSTPAVALGRAVGRKAAAEMLLTGRPVTARKAQQIGLLNDVFDTADALDAHVSEIADTIASKSPVSIRMGKPTFAEQLGLTLDGAYEVAGETMCANAVDQECAEGISAFLEKRPPNW